MKTQLSILSFLIGITLTTASFASPGSYCPQGNVPQKGTKVGENLLNDQWTLSSNAKLSSGVFTLTPSATQTATAQQILTLKPNTLYTAQVCVKGSYQVPPTLAIMGVGAEENNIHVQRGKAQTYLDPMDTSWKLYHFTFYTGPGSNGTAQVIYQLSGYQNNLGIGQQFAEAVLVEGALPVLLPPAPTPGTNIISNPTLTSNKDWVFDRNTTLTKLVTGTPNYIALNPSDTESARVSQVLATPLTPNTTYTLTFDAKTNGTADATVFITNSGAPMGTGTRVVGQPAWKNYSYTFTTPASMSMLKLMLESYKQQTGEVDITNFVMNAKGNEQPSSGGGVAPTKTIAPLVDNFSTYAPGTPLKSNKWLIANKQWGGNNNGVSDANVSFAKDADGSQYLKLTAIGGTVDGSLNQRIGAAIATKDYYASGSYYVCARVPKHEGVVSAFWPFHYVAYQPNTQEGWNEPNPIRNTEIDWEFPTSTLSNDKPVSYNYGRLNNWGGQFGGEGGEDKERVDFTQYNKYADKDGIVRGHPINDGKFHQFGIIWKSGTNNVNGTTRRPGSIQWTFDPVCSSNPSDIRSPTIVASVTAPSTTYSAPGASYGQDNIPYRAARFWIGDWFPGYGHDPKTGEYTYKAGGQSYWGWGGTPDFDKDSLDIKWVAIYPDTTQGRDKWEAESAPDAANWSPASRYPIAGGTPTPPPTPIQCNSLDKKISLTFDSSFKDRTVRLEYQSKTANPITQVQGNASQDICITPNNSVIKVDGYQCWSNATNLVNTSISSVFISLDKYNGVQCRLQ